MNHEIKTILLRDALGTVSDIFVNEAQTEWERLSARRTAEKKRRRRNTLRLLLTAAALAVAVALLATGLRQAMEKQYSFLPSAPDKAEEELTRAEQLLADYTFENELTAQSRAENRITEPDLFSGVAALYWQSPDTGELYSLPLGDAEEYLMNTGYGSAYSLNASAPTFARLTRVWVCDGHGTVVTPYLYGRPGNIGYGELFEYDPELIPPSSYVYTVKRLLTT